MQPASKRRRAVEDDDQPDSATLRARRAGFLSSLSRPVSPPPIKSPTSVRHELAANPDRKQSNHRASSQRQTDLISAQGVSSNAVFKSPFQLSYIRDLPPSDNIDAVRLKDILGHPLIRETWIFNFCHDVDWTMQHFDPDVRDLVEVKIIHGSWRRDDTNKMRIDEACRRWKNVESLQAYLPDAFGTHHSKMFVMFRHDDQAQVVIHTANMLAKDWTNMTQAVWQSPLLPLRGKIQDNKVGEPGSGSRFKYDLVRYLKAYGAKLRKLVQQVMLYDFSEIRAALIASVPSEFEVSSADDAVWGHEALRRVVSSIPVKSVEPHFVYQVSSIASLPASWLAETLCRATGGTDKSTSIVFPTAEDVRLSLDGYAAGGSIHTKAQTDTHLKQINLIRPQLCKWTQGQHSAGRHLAAPHIKTYVRFAARPNSTNPTPDIEFALVTSANLSTQAWGTVPKLAESSKDRQQAIIKVQSFEIGVLVWPALLGSGANATKMLPIFKKDTPPMHLGDDSLELFGLRMPYDLPLTSYQSAEMPWSPHLSYTRLDSHGLQWPPST